MALFAASSSSSSSSSPCGGEMGSEAPDAASISMPRGEEEEGDARGKFTYSRGFLLSVGGSEACKNLPAGIDGAWVLRAPFTANLWRWRLGLPEPERAREPNSFHTGVGSKSKPCTRVTPASFGASATAKISVDASLAGAIIGRGGANIRNISRVTGARLAIRDHESDTGLKNIELEGTFDQIKDASDMARELVVGIGGSAPPQAKNTGGRPGGSFKTKLCEKFNRGSCTFGDRCCFAHGEDELRKPTAARDPSMW